MRRSAQPFLYQPGYLEPAGEPSPYSIAGMFGGAQPNPLVLTNHPSHLEAGARTFPGVVDVLSGVQTVDLNNANQLGMFKPSAANLLHPMHSEAFWVLAIALVCLGLFSGAVKLGPFEARAGKR